MTLSASGRSRPSIKPLNQYHVVMEVAPEYWQNPETLKDIYVSTSGGAVSGTQSSNAVSGTVVLASTSSSVQPASSTSTSTTSGTADAASSASAIQAQAAENQQLNTLTNARGGSSSGASIATTVETMVPLSAFSAFGPGTTPLSVNHQGAFVATTFSFNLPQGESLGVALAAIEQTMARLDVPLSVHGSFAGTANLYKASLANEPILIAGVPDRDLHRARRAV